MTCYSARYIGDKIYTYHQHEEYLLQKLVRKIEKKYNRSKLRDLAPIFRKGYYKSNGESLKWTNCYRTWRPDNPSSKRKITLDCPCVWFDFRYYPNNSNSYKHVTPEIVLDSLKESAMVSDDLKVMENLRHSSNAGYFRVILPVKYYNYRSELTYENKKIPKQFQPYKKEYRLILDFLIMNYNELFNRIYMIPNNDERCMEYYLRYKGDWHFDYQIQLKNKIIKELSLYYEEQDMKELVESISVFMTQELDERGA